jgi:hypothetical protein
MKNPMEHERMRFKSMSLQQLTTRLGRITQLDKLKMFIIVAGEFRLPELKNQAQNKLMELTGPRPTTLSTIQAWQNPIKSKNVKVTSQTKTKIETPTVLRRHLEF